MAKPTVISAEEYRELAPVKGHKYRAQRRVVDGETFDSKGELTRYMALRLMQKAGEIQNLRRQVKIALTALGGEIVGLIIVDFQYETSEGRTVFEDFKGMTTPLAKWKLKHLQAQYPLARVKVSHRGE